MVKILIKVNKKIQKIKMIKANHKKMQRMINRKKKILKMAKTTQNSKKFHKAQNEMIKANKNVIK